MNLASIRAMGEELVKMSSLADRPYVRDHARKAGGFAKKGWEKFRSWYNRQGTVTQYGAVGGIVGGTMGAAKGALKNDPEINYDTGELQRPGLATRGGRAVKGAVAGGASGAASAAGGAYVVKKLQGH
jgi:hypothetical protein